MSGLINKLTGHHNKDHTTDSHEHGKPYGTTNNQQATTTTTTTSTTNNSALPNQSINQQSTLANNQSTLGGLHNNATTAAAGTTNPYGNSTAASTQRTGAAYTDANVAGVNNQSTVNQQVVNQQRDDAITRSEEQLRLAKNTVETGTAQLNKYVTVDRVEKQIPVSRERLVIERFPINQSNIGSFSSNAVIGEQHFETVLYEDRVAALKEVVPIERIRLAKELEQRVEHVGADLRKEHVDYVYQPLVPGAKNDDGLAHNAQARHDFSYDTHRKTDTSYGQATKYDQANAKSNSSLTDASLPGSHGKNSGMHGSGTNPLSDKIDNIGRGGLGHTSGTGLMGANALASGTGHV